MSLEHLAPGTVAEFCRARGRADYVREQDARQYSVRLGVLDGAGDEPLDLIHDRDPSSPHQKLWSIPGKLMKRAPRLSLNRSQGQGVGEYSTGAGG